MDSMIVLLVEDERIAKAIYMARGLFNGFFKDSDSGSPSDHKWMRLEISVERLGPQKTTERWREEATRLGIGDLYLCHIENIFGEALTDPVGLGFDAAVEFQPKLKLIPPPLSARAKGWLFPHIPNNHISPYAQLVNNALAEHSAPYLRYPCVCPSWDNTARRPNRGLTLKNASPELYERWLREVIRRTPENRDGDKIVFINAWNEWAEGCHLEPCQKWGRQYLEATLRAVGGQAKI